MKHHHDRTMNRDIFGEYISIVKSKPCGEDQTIFSVKLYLSGLLILMSWEYFFVYIKKYYQRIKKNYLFN